MIVIYNPRVVPDEKIVFFANVAFKSVICLYLIGHRSFKLNQKRTTLFFHSKRNQRFSFVQNCWSLDSLDRERRISFNLVPSSNGKSGYLHFKVKLENTHPIQLVSSLTGLDLTKKENTSLFACSEGVKYNHVELETSCMLILNPTVSVLKSNHGALW